jgi:TRAP-type C4-dicarboxylate transport system permease large subunit
VSFKYLIILMLVLIIGSLGKALYHLSARTPGDSRKMVKALTWRIGLSVGLFVLLMVAYYKGWITPTGRALPETRRRAPYRAARAARYSQ